MTGNQGKSQISISENNACNSRKKRHKAPIKVVPGHLRLSPQSSVLSPEYSQPQSLNFTQVCIDLLRSGKRVRFRAPGYSMYPTILNGDEITVEPIKADAIRVGDIILYQDQENLIAHRVAKIDIKKDINNDAQSSARGLPRRSHAHSVTKTGSQSFIILRGDARPACDDPVPAEHILGKVVLIDTNGRSINPYGFKAKLIFNVRRWVFRLKRFQNPL